jgi:hypothetical protein
MFRALLVVCLGLALVAASGIGGFAGSEASSAPTRTVAPAPQLSQLLGFASGTLVRIDPQSLRPLAGTRIRVGSGGCAPRQGGTACWTNPPWTVSPNGTRLAVVAQNHSASLRLVDAARMRVTANVRVDGGAIGALAWLAPGTLLAVQEIAGERQRLLAVDLVKRRVSTRTSLDGSVQRLARTGQELVMLLGPAQSIGVARIAVADRRGAVRFVRLEQILAGSKLLGTGSDHRVDSQLPGLAVDPEGSRAFVVAKSLIAEINLRTLAVSYHTLQRKASFLARLWNWLEPAAAAKQVSGYWREARWLGGGLLAISGTDTEQGEMQPAGLLVADTRGWSVRTIDRSAMSFEVAGDVLLAMGGSWDPSTERMTGFGLVTYGFDGGKRFQLFDGEQAWLALVYGGRAYVGISGQGAVPLRIVDLATGHVVGTRQPSLPWLLLGPGSGWWGG